MDRNDKELPSIRIPITKSFKTRSPSERAIKNKGDAYTG